MRYTIIGGGIAGTTAAEEIRRLDADADITLVSEEHEALYSRVLLPHYAKGMIPRERIFLKREAWYAEKDIEWLAGMRVDAIDVRNRHVALSDGRELPYDKLLIATGGEPRTLPYDGENACYFHSLGDAEHLVSLMASRDGRAMAFGGSFIAAELLDVFLHRGRDTVAAFRGPWMFHRVLDEESGRLITDHLHGKGAEVRPGCAAPEHLGATDRDIVGIGAGTEPDLSWIRDAGIAVNRGVLANARLETNVPDVYAAGDVAEFDDLLVGRALTAGNWPSAVMQGRLAGQNMSGRAPGGAPVEFRNVSAYATNLAGLDIIAVGDTDRAATDSIRVIAEAHGPRGGGVTQLFFRGGKIVGGTMVNRTAHRTPVVNAIRAGAADMTLG
jgi:NAD(P)H-nitrite reductase large subunit